MPAAERPIVIIGAEATGEDPLTWGYIASSDHQLDDQGAVVDSTYGSIIVKGLTVVFRSKHNAIEGQDVAIGNSKLAVEHVADGALNIFANGKADIVTSVVDADTPDC